MKKTKNKILSSILALTMAVGMLPMASTTVQAANPDEAMVLGMNGVQNWDKGGSLTVAETDKIVMGANYSEPVEWVRLNDEGLMFSTGSLEKSAFLKGISSGSYYPGTTLNSEMINLYNTDLDLTAIEKLAIADTTLDGDSMYPNVDDLIEQKLFPLSQVEFDEFVGEYTELANDSSLEYYWLRTSWDLLDAFYVLNYDGFRLAPITDDNIGVRPAFNLNLSSVLFTSATEGGKSSFNVSEANPILSEVSDTAPTSWKMTLLDGTRSFAVTDDPTIDTTTNIVSFSYTGAQTGTNEYISVMITDDSDSITHYGKVANNSESGMASFTLPAGVTGDVNLKIFNEQDNGDNQTDLSSAFVDKTAKYLNALESVTQADVIYGTAPTPTVGYGDNTQNGADPTFTYKEQGADDSTYSPTVPTYVGDYTVKATSAKNDTALEGTATANFSITTADQTPTITDTTDVQVNNSIDLSTLVTNAMGDVSFAKVSGDGELTGATYTASNTTGTATFTVNITGKDENNDGMNEYNPYTGTNVITVAITATPHIVTPPTIVSGASQDVVQGERAEFKSDADFGGYKDTTVTVNGITKTIHTAGNDNGNASAANGSIIVTLSGAYTETLPLGTHTIFINSTNGSASTQFTVIAKEQSDTPQTGDDSNVLLYLIIAFISLVGVGYIGYRKGSY